VEKTPRIIQPADIKSFEVIAPEPYLVEPDPSWEDKLRNTIDRIRKDAKTTGEPNHIIREKLDLIRAHDPALGPFVIMHLSNKTITCEMVK
jgi:hypothetical protein